MITGFKSVVPEEAMQLCKSFVAVPAEKKVVKFREDSIDVGDLEEDDSIPASNSLCSPSHESELERTFKALSRAPQERSETDLDIIFNEVLRPIHDAFLANLEENVKRSLCSKLVKEQLCAGTVLMDYGDVGDKVYIIWSGKLQLDVPLDRLRHQIGNTLARATRSSSTITNETSIKGSSFSVELATLKCLEKGRVIGERAMASSGDCKRNARATAVEDSVVLSLTREDFFHCVKIAGGAGSEASNLQWRISFLSSLDRGCLAGLDATDVSHVADHMREVAYKGGEAVLRQGEDVDRVVFIKNGFCKVVRQLHPRHHESFVRNRLRGTPGPNPFGPDGDTGEAKTDGLHRLSDDGTSETLASESSFASRLSKLIPYANVHASSTEDEATSGALGPGSHNSSMAVGSLSERSECLSKKSKFQYSLNHSQRSDAPQADEIIVDQLQAGRSFGTMEVFEGLPYQSSLIASPWATVYVVSKYDLIRNTPKTVLHRLFCDYKTRLTDERIIQRMKQMNRWNDYKGNLLGAIKTRKRLTGSSERTQAVDARSSYNRSSVHRTLAAEDFARIGAGESFWGGRAQTPPVPAHANKDASDVFRINVVVGDDGRRDVELIRERRDASMVALDARLVMMLSNARLRDKLRRSQTQNQRQGVTLPSIPSQSTPKASGTLELLDSAGESNLSARRDQGKDAKCQGTLGREPPSREAAGAFNQYRKQGRTKTKGLTNDGPQKSRSCPEEQRRERDRNSFQPGCQDSGGIGREGNTGECDCVSSRMKRLMIPANARRSLSAARSALARSGSMQVRTHR